MAARIGLEARRLIDRKLAPRAGRRFGERDLLEATGAGSIDDLWALLRERPYAFPTDIDKDELERLAPGECTRVTTAARDARARCVSMLGLGPVLLPTPIDWHHDYKTGYTWDSARPSNSIRVVDWDSSSDIKVPWELSRLQWLVPCAQSYIVTKNEQDAIAAREVVHEWIEGNPYGVGVNWVLAMEGALRVLTWTYLFHALSGSAAWRNESYRSAFLRALFLHGRSVARNLERSTVNGNHFTAGAAGLVFAGLFFPGSEPKRWARDGWRALSSEIPRQVGADGVDFEASTAYHRLVCELFALPALYRQQAGLSVSSEYRERLGSMGAFAQAYTRLDGTAPFWGDADDGRALPLGGQPRSDHRYLLGLTGGGAPRDRSELAWALGPKVAAALPETADATTRGFPDGGVFVIRRGDDHLFVDAGPVGLAGRGGHGHSDVLSFELVLNGQTVVTDSGSYTYTGDPAARNRFRSTSYHSTPRVDGEEINRLVSPRDLWSLRDDAHPIVHEWAPLARRPRLRASHFAYARLPRPVTVTRSFAVDLDVHAAVILDEFEGDGAHDVVVPFHLAPEAEPILDDCCAALSLGDLNFAIAWTDGWAAELTEGWLSPSYGVRVSRPVLELRRSGELRTLATSITTVERRPTDVTAFAAAMLSE